MHLFYASSSSRTSSLRLFFFSFSPPLFASTAAVSKSKHDFSQSVDALLHRQVQLVPQHALQFPRDLLTSLENSPADFKWRILVFGQLEAPLSIDTPRYLSPTLSRLCCCFAAAGSGVLLSRGRLSPVNTKTKPNRNKRVQREEGTEGERLFLNKVSLCHGNHDESRHERQATERKGNGEERTRETKRERERKNVEHNTHADRGFRGTQLVERRRARYAVCRPLETPAAVSRARLAFVVEGTRRYHRVTRTNRHAFDNKSRATNNM